MSLFVGRIPREATEKDLDEIFSKIGKLTRCEIKRDGYGFIDYEDKMDAEDAIKSLHGYEIHGGRLVVEFAKGPGHGSGPLGGRPPRRFDRPMGDRREPTGGCFTCGQPGHWSRDCPEGGAGRPPVGAGSGSGSAVSGSSYRGGASDRFDDRQDDRYGRRPYRSPSPPPGRRYERSRSRERYGSDSNYRSSRYDRSRSRSPVRRDDRYSAY